MDRVRVKDIIDLVDYDRTGGKRVTIADSEGFSVICTKALLLDLIANFTVTNLDATGDTIVITLLDEDFDRVEKMEAQE